MYIRPRQLWWLLPIFTGLFLIGIGLGKWLDKHGGENQTTPLVNWNDRAEEDRSVIAELIGPLAAKQDLPFSVEMQDHTLTGHFQGDKFELKGSIAGHEMAMKRDGKEVIVFIDGEQQDPQLLPFALYTPFEHAKLIQQHLQSIRPLPIVDAKQKDLLGYKISLPPAEVASMISLWLGPRFPVDDVMKQLTKQVAVDYHFWYDASTKKLRMLVVNLLLDTPAGKKQDQLLFRM